MNGYLLVFLGGGIGSALRLGSYRLTRIWLLPEIPWGTFAVNVAGSFAAGVVTAWLMGRSTGESDPARLFLMSGILGGFTTFSAFSVDTLQLWQRVGLAAATAYACATMLLSIAAAVTGFALVKPIP